MNEEEKEAIEEVKSYIEWVRDRGTNTDKNIEIILNLIDRLQEKIIQISEICIDESKCHISTKDAIEKIRRII